MPTPSILIDPSKPGMRQQVDSLAPTPGYCVFIDIVGSTAMKQKGMREWIALIYNCFANSHFFLDQFSPIKAIGDALMFYIEIPDLKQSGYTPLQIFDGLWQLATESDPNFPAVKIGAARCEKAYSLTFLRGNQDYYGIDVDMTARLQSIAAEREIVIEQKFYDDISADYQGIGNQEQFESYRALRGPVPEPLKGIPDKINAYRAAASNVLPKLLPIRG